MTVTVTSTRMASSRQKWALRRFRRYHDVTLRQLERRSGYSITVISEFERDQIDGTTEDVAILRRCIREIVQERSA